VNVYLYHCADCGHVFEVRETVACVPSSNQQSAFGLQRGPPRPVGLAGVCISVSLFWVVKSILYVPARVTEN
jgi:hypothetical protein